jgi:Galactose oxidase, central domain
MQVLAYNYNYNPPSGRSSAGSFYDDVNDQLVIIGGKKESFEVFKDIWTYSFSKLTWNQIIPLSSYTPGKLTGTCGVFFPSTRSFYVYGGSKFYRIYTELWRFSIDSYTVRYI